MNVIAIPEADITTPRIKISGHDGEGVWVIVVDDLGGRGEVRINPVQARELAVRLMQAADIADPECTNRYYGGRGL